MTAALICDGCANLLSTRGADDDTPSGWITVSFDAAPGEGLAGLTRPISLDLTIDEHDEAPVAVEPIDDVSVYEPPAHFCSIGCLASWSSSKVAG